jgi:hypothetical protein
MSGVSSGPLREAFSFPHGCDSGAAVRGGSGGWRTGLPCRGGRGNVPFMDPGAGIGGVGRRVVGSVYRDPLNRLF